MEMERVEMGKGEGGRGGGGRGGGGGGWGGGGGGGEGGWGGVGGGEGGAELALAGWSPLPTPLFRECKSPEAGGDGAERGRGTARSL